MTTSLSRGCLTALEAGPLSVAGIRKAMPELVPVRSLTYCIEQLRQQGRLVRANPGARPAHYSITPAGEQYLASPASCRGRPRGFRAVKRVDVPNSVFQLGRLA